LSAPIPKIYFADGGRLPGEVYSYDPVTHAETSIYTRPSGNLHSFLFAPWDSSQLYFVNANEYKIYRKSLVAGGGPEEVVYTHTTWVRDIAVKDYVLYFSEASGGASDGGIWRAGAGGPSLFYRVRLSEVDWWWNGHFTFDKGGTLYLSSGNTSPASLYRVDWATDTVAKRFTDPEAITGMAFGDDGALYYANWATKIYRLDLGTMTKTTAYTGPTHQWMSDVRFMPGVAAIPPTGPLPAGVSAWVMPWGVGGIRVDAIKTGLNAGLIDYTDAMSHIAMINAPFGGHLGFSHGASTNPPIPNQRITHYRWQYRKAPAGDWVEFTEPVNVYYILEVPGALPILVPYNLGPKLLDGKYLYEFRPDPSTLPKPPNAPNARATWVSSGLMFTECSGYWETVAPDILPGAYDILLSVYGPNPAGSGYVQVGPGTATSPGPFQFVVPTGPAGGQINPRLALPAEIDTSGGFKFPLVIDNRPCVAVIDAPKIGTETADECGILRYTPGDSTPVRIAFRAEHPAGYGVFSFSTIRGATPVPTATVGTTEVSASTAGVYTKNAGYFESLPLHFTIPELLGPCPEEAAFSENLNVYAKATTGNGYRIGDYDASAVWAFALFKKTLLKKSFK
jgi:hypothetical protein